MPPHIRVIWMSLIWVLLFCPNPLLFWFHRNVFCSICWLCSLSTMLLRATGSQFETVCSSAYRQLNWQDKCTPCQLKPYYNTCWTNQWLLEISVLLWRHSLDCNENIQKPVLPVYQHPPPTHTHTELLGFWTHHHSWVMWCWELNLGHPSCKASTLPTKLHP